MKVLTNKPIMIYNNTIISKIPHKIKPVNGKSLAPVIGVITFKVVNL